MFKVRLYFRIRLSMFMHYLYSVFMNLFPPSPQGCKGPGKMSSSQAEKNLQKGKFGHFCHYPLSASKYCQMGCI